jgi:hypothetical protein
MAHSCVAIFPQTAPSASPLDLTGPAPHVEAPIDPAWAGWAARLETLLAGACRGLAARGRRAERISVRLTLADGRVVKRSLALARPTAQAHEARAAALGLLRLLLAEQPGAVAGLGLRLERLVEGADQPIRFERYLQRKRSRERATAFARVAGMLASLGSLAGLLGLGTR